jgi:hypothetical protein
LQGGTLGSVLDRVDAWNRGPSNSVGPKGKKILIFYSIKILEQINC